MEDAVLSAAFTLKVNILVVYTLSRSVISQWLVRVFADKSASFMQTTSDFSHLLATKRFLEQHFFCNYYPKTVSNPKQPHAKQSGNNYFSLVTGG